MTHEQIIKVETSMDDAIFARAFRGMHIIYSYMHIHVHDALTICTSKHVSDPTRIINHDVTCQICIHLHIHTMKA